MTSDKIFIVQFGTAELDYVQYVEEINTAYCSQHGYGYYIEKDSDKIKSALEHPKRSYTWYKPKLILDVFDRYNPEYVLFLDMDACVVDFTQRIESYIDSNYDILFTEDVGHHSSMNAGVFLIKNTQWTRDFMNLWWYSAETLRGIDIPELSIPEEHKNNYGYFKTALWHDQSCLTHLYKTNSDLHQKIKIIPPNQLNWREPFDNNFIYHGFAYGDVPYRKLNMVHDRVLQIQREVVSDSLVELGKIYPTDKEYLHRYYSRVYQDVLYPLKDTTKKIVELGVLEGHSLMCWKHFFKNAQVIGLDINIEQCIFRNEDRISVEYTSGDNREQLQTLIDKHQDVDIFVDDGGHKMHEQQITLATIFKGLKSAGMYILEDLHTSLECRMPEKQVFGWGDPTKTTTLEMLEHFNKTGKIVSDYLTADECAYLEQHIKSCDIYRDVETSITAVLKKVDTTVVTPSTDAEQLLNTIIETATQLKQQLQLPRNIESAPKLAAVYYVSLMNDWKERTAMIFDRMKFSGLYDAADELYLVAADTENKFTDLAEFCKNYPKFIVEYEPRNFGSEYRGIKRVEEIGRRRGAYNILYLHSKGVFNKFLNVSQKEGIHQLKVDSVNCWLDMMTYFTVDNWKECVDKLNNGYATAGARNIHRWWWGNFWWASSVHIKQLKEFNPGSRWDCESWIHEGLPNEQWESIKYYEQYKFRYHPYYTVLPRYLYDDSDKSDITFTIHKAEYGCFNEQQDEGQPLPEAPDVIDVTDQIRNMSTAQQIKYEDHIAKFHELHTCAGKEKLVRIHFSTSREPSITYVITTHPIFPNIEYLYTP